MTALHGAKRATACLLGLGTAVPAHILPQDFVTLHARAVFGSRRNDFERLETIFANTGVTRRHSVQPIEWYLKPQGWPERSQAFLTGAGGLFLESAARALEEAGLRPADVDTVVTVSTTGIAAPSLEARLMCEFGFRQDIRRVPVFGIGCAGGVSGLALASRFARASPGEVVLVVTVELCTLAFRLDDATTASIVATAIFGDGAAAAVVSCDRGDGIASLGESGEHTWPDTLDIMGWTMDPTGFGTVLSRSVPQFVEAEIRYVADDFLARCGLEPADISHFVFHPGGSKVIAALERAFAMQSGTLRRERAILSEFGNMSAPTVLFILRRALDEGCRGRILLAALGPGFSASMLICEA